MVFMLILSTSQSCNMEKSFLFDVVSKVYIATDSNPVDMQSYELCSDMIDVVIDVSCIYGYEQLRLHIKDVEVARSLGILPVA